jgi:hypothetical protein
MWVWECVGGEKIQASASNFQNPDGVTLPGFLEDEPFDALLPAKT